MESINPDDIDYIEHSQISKIILKNGKTIKVDIKIPSKKSKKNKDKNIYRNNTKNYKISQKIINLTIINKKENQNFNIKNKICKNINFFYNKNNTNNIDIRNELKNKKNNIIIENKNKKNNDFFLDNLNFNDIWKNSKEDKEIEKIITIDNDIESNNEYRTIINEFNKKNNKQIILNEKKHNMNNLLKSKIKRRDDYYFDLTDHFNSLVDNFRKKAKEIKGNKYNKKDYNTYLKGKNDYKYSLLNNKHLTPFTFYNMSIFKKKENYSNKNNKYLLSSCNLKKKDIYMRNSNFELLKNKYIKKNTSFSPKIYKYMNFGSEIILPSNKIW